MYYIIHLPIGISKEFVYSSVEPVAEGARVLVSFNRREMMGICGKAYHQKPDSRIAYKPVNEVLDFIPILPIELIKLGEWLADYYHCSVGQALFAMLPALLAPDIDALLRWVGKEVPPQFANLHKLLQDGEFASLALLRSRNRGFPPFILAEMAEESGLVEIQRRVSQRDKPRTVNFIRIINQDIDIHALPTKQKEAMELILAHPEDFPMSEISSLVSYSVVKALVKKGWITIYPRKIAVRSIFLDPVGLPKEIDLNPEQRGAIEAINSAYGKFGVNLLFGITGSGKTEVYINVIRSYLSEGKSVLFLIPEIALTPQMVERFQSEFGAVLAIFHSQLSDRERLIQWRRIAAGECRIVIGARSAVFAPLPKLGLIIVDEEHEQSYKQDNNPRYNGRDTAIVRAMLQGAQVIIGSATPSLESWQNAQKGKYAMQVLSSRPLDYKLPEVQIINLCDEPERELLSETMLHAINQRLERKEQVILFQNRRGYSSYMQCLKCGKLITCGNCEISMYYHRDSEEMQCHYCGFHIPSPRKCPHCGSFSFSYGAPGTQKVEQTLKLCFPQAKILRLDSDSSRKKDSHSSMYKRMKNQEIDILLGTQMISKGLDFPFVTLVGIVMADISLNVPDFRAAERTFQLITQVAGRSGRGERNGEVLIQTYNPRHYAIDHASRQDYPAFAEEEMSYRRRLYYPPYYRLARILYQAKDLEILKSVMADLQQCTLKLRGLQSVGDLLILGPVAAPFAKLNNLFRYHLILKARTIGIMSLALKFIGENLKLPSAVNAQMDVDPMGLM
ncbi:MAG: primosomal protein N' [Candidatus Cloacimonadaceae bacterium]|nr:primosomal protein N' [Candidatus Cloacimonadaceae bacterium]